MTKNELITELQRLFENISITPHIQNDLPDNPRKQYFAVIPNISAIHFYVENENEINETAYYADNNSVSPQ